eukprot:CCRYP_006003-RA/>CCRYP_006003-RA protein AED:0.37 eAED:0.37 QI:0/0/0/0.5/0/0/2/0/118
MVPCPETDTRQFVVNTPGHLFSGYDREDSHDKFHMGTIFQDAATGIIWVECQVSIGAGKTIMLKINFEEWLWEMTAAEITHYCTVMMESSLMTCFVRIASPNISHRVSLVLEQNIKIP